MQKNKKMLLASSGISWILDNVFFPRVCIICKTWNKNELCNECERLVEKASGPCTNTGGLYDYGDICYFGRYIGRIKDAVASYKFNGEIWRGKAFGRLLYCKYKDYMENAGFYCITYVPTGKTSIKTRGFDQCYEMAKEISLRSGIKMIKLFVPQNMQKNKQSALGRIDRKTNTNGRFMLSENINESLIGKRVLLIDDIITTGSTIRECAELLSDYGIERTDCMVFATGRSDISSG